MGLGTCCFAVVLLVCRAALPPHTEYGYNAVFPAGAVDEQIAIYIEFYIFCNLHLGTQELHGSRFCCAASVLLQVWILSGCSYLRICNHVWHMYACLQTLIMSMMQHDYKSGFLLGCTD